MNDHQFSNQKSALEEYFASLLTEDDSQDNMPAKQTEKEAIESTVDQVETTATVIEQVVVNKPTSEETSEPVISRADSGQEVEEEKTAGQVRRTSIEEMLASVEEKLQEEKKQEESVTKLDFAEPEPVIPMPLPEVAPPVVEEETVVETKIEVEETIAEEVVTEKQVEAVAEQSVVAVSSEPPEWAEQPFQCLLFNVGGLALAVPLVRLNGVIPWSENIVETPNQTDWYLGVLMNHGNKVQVIDTAVMVLPPEHRADLPEEPSERFSHILLVDDQRWGLACDSIGDVVWIKRDDVKWRSNKTKRPWLLGTAIEHMCAVMDTEAFADMLEGKK